MASADLGRELECSICLSTYSDPVSLQCGHSYCCLCINHVLDKQEESGNYWCPQCRKRFRGRPELQRNIALRNIVENFVSTQKVQDETGIICTYCMDSPVAAVKSCLMCDASLCENHLRVHSKSPEHILSDPSTTRENKKCSIHKKILEYFCNEDAACICVACCLIGDHKGHKMEQLPDASEKMKKKLRINIRKLMLEKDETDKRVQILLQHTRQVQGKFTGVTGRVTSLFRDIGRQLADLETRVLNEVSRRSEMTSRSLSDLIQQLEIKKNELSRKICHMEKLCNMTDPLTFLQEQDIGDLCDTEDRGNGGRGHLENQKYDGDDLDLTRILHTLHKGLSDLITRVNGGVHIPEPADLLLDVSTASNMLQVSDDGRTASRSRQDPNPPGPLQGFQNHPRVLSSQRFFSGQHYWDVDIGVSRSWRIGMCYPGADQMGQQAAIGSTAKSWCLCKRRKKYSVMHDGKGIHLPGKVTNNRIRMSLDFEAGRISFYELNIPTRHLHTFTATFTEPLHVALSVWGGCLKVSGREQEL